MNEVSGKIAAVVGAGCVGDEIGNGRATALTLAREGAVVVCADIDAASAERTAAMIVDEGGQATGVQLDITDEAAVATFVDDIVSTHGRLDVLDNNAGIGVIGGVVDLDRADWDRVFAVNVTGPYLTMKYAIPRMVAQGGGSVVNISSIAGVRFSGVPYAAYYASKAALNHLTRTTAAEFAASNVRVNAVLPGLMKTPMVSGAAGLTAAYSSADVEEMWATRDRQVPMGHMGTPWDVANAVLYLASDRASYVTGTELRVDGGIAVYISK
ncbi:SDR family NAD(P)-dependent oxidoreductase [Mycobacterium sp. NPDC003449]